MALSFRNFIKPTSLWAVEITDRLKALEDLVGTRVDGALVFGSTPQSIPDDTPTDVEDWDTVVYDDLDFFDIGTPDIFTIPVTDPVIERVQLYFQYSWQPNVAGNRSFFLEQNDVGNVRGGLAGSGDARGGGVAYVETVYSMPVSCEPGDTFRMVVTQDRGDALLLGLQGFGITVAK
jgi:hypothetical protein